MTSPTPDPNTVAFCQNCGRPLTADERRAVGGAIFCEPCLAARLAGAPFPGSSAGTTSAPPFPLVGPPANPFLAALLGFIPGVGAMYNGQYAKGIVHVVIFAILVSVADQHGIFHLVVFGWVLYQIIDAHQTAQARRNGTPLPNPFGLNDIGDRLGFGKAWSSTASAPPLTGTYTPPAAPSSPGPGPAPDWERSAWEQPSATQGAASASAAYTQQPPYNPGPQAPPYSSVPAEAFETRPANNFPTGALWLIGLGVVFLIGNAGIFHALRVLQIIPFVIIGFGVWIFTLRMSQSGRRLVNDGSSMYRQRFVSALWGSSWIVLAGVLFLLANLHILSWGRSWPLWIILSGVLTFLQRTIPPEAQPMPGPYSSYPPPGTPSAASPAASAPVTGIVVAPHDGEGRQL